MTRLRLMLAAAVLLMCGAATALPVLAFSRGFVHVGSFRQPGGVARTTPLLVIGGDASLPAGTRAPVMVIAGTLRLNGPVGDVAIGLDADLLCGPQSVLAGDAIALGGRVVRQPGAVLHGNIVVATGPGQGSNGRAGLLHDIQLAALASLSVFVLALLLSAAFPWRVLVVAATVRRYSWQSLAVAAGGMAGLPLLCVPLLLSVVGLPLAMLLLLAALGLWLTGVAGAGLLIGHRLLAVCGAADSLLRSTFLGLLVLALLGLIPGFGLLVLVGLGCLGAGATVLSLVDRSRAVTMIMAGYSGQR
jgi:hypothetical protein